MTTNGMTDEQLIGYCEFHCETERALFNSEQINRMLELAGHPGTFVHQVEPGQWISVGTPMAELCKLARERMNKGGAGDE